MRIIVDNQTLSEVTNGHSVLKDVEMRPIFVRITRFIKDLHARGQSSPTPCTPMLDWRPRELNTEADSACNLVMDRNSSFQWFSKNFEKHVRCSQNIYMHSDGGCRKTGISATGWRIAAVHPRDFTRAVTIAKGGSLIEGNLSSLEIEAIALEELLNIYINRSNMYSKSINTDNINNNSEHFQ